MPARDILQLGHPLLWRPSLPVADPTAAEVRALAQDLADTLAAFRASAGFGRGIAAPQVGVLRRVIFLRMQPTGFAGVLCNPRITWQGPEPIELWDGCFSFPDLMVRVVRARRVRVAYEDEHGAACTLEAKDDLAELLQHEIDHLDGILATDRAALPRALATRAEWQTRILPSEGP